MTFNAATIIEEWRDIEGYPDYQVSNQGRVKSLKFNKERILKQNNNTAGYPTVGLSNVNKTPKSLMVHSLVSQAFLGDREPGQVVDHISRDKTDNNVLNLRYCSYSDNGLNRDVRGSIIITRYNTFLVQYTKSDRVRCNKTLKTRYEAEAHLLYLQINYPRVIV